MGLGLRARVGDGLGFQLGFAAGIGQGLAGLELTAGAKVKAVLLQPS